MWQTSNQANQATKSYNNHFLLLAGANTHCSTRRHPKIEELQITTTKKLKADREYFCIAGANRTDLIRFVFEAEHGRLDIIHTTQVPGVSVPVASTC